MQTTKWLTGAMPATAKSAVKILRAEGARLARSDRYGWPALDDMDRTLRSTLPSKGVFLEIGANDGYSYSNTYHLEKYDGWRGILIEPLPSMFRICRSHRRRAACYNVACVGPGGPRTLTLVDRGLMAVSLGLMGAGEESRRVAGHTRKVVVRTSTLSRLIDRSGLGTPDFISVDVEGAEQQVIAGLDLRRHAPAYLLVETDAPDAVSRIVAPYLRRCDQLSHHDWLFERV